MRTGSPRPPHIDQPQSYRDRGRFAIPEIPEGEDWKTKSELASHLKMTTRWIEMQQKLGLPVMRLGAANRYQISEVEAWLRQRYHSASKREEI